MFISASGLKTCYAHGADVQRAVNGRKDSNAKGASLPRISARPTYQ